MPLYRVNFGNGQVDRETSDRREAMRDLERARKDGPGFLQVYIPGTADDPGDWFNARVEAGGGR